MREIKFIPSDEELKEMGFFLDRTSWKIYFGVFDQYQIVYFIIDNSFNFVSEGYNEFYPTCKEDVIKLIYLFNKI